MRLQTSIALGLLAVVTVSPAQATLVTLHGTDVDFLLDDQQAGLALYCGGCLLDVNGRPVPTVAGDSLIFAPTTFRAESTNGAPSPVSAHATLSIQVQSHSPSATDLGAATAREFGDYFISPPGSVSAVAQLGATNLQASDPLASFQQDIEQTGTLTTAGANAWSLTTSVNFQQAWTKPTDLVQIDLQNDLLATTTANPSNPSDAWIEKKFAGMRVDVAVVPLPATLPLLLSTLGGVGALARRRART